MRREVRDRAVHRETAVGGDQSEARILRRAELRFQIGHVVVLVTKSLRFAEPDAVDDGGVIQFIADHGVLFAEQRFEQTAVGVEAGGIKDRFLCPEKFRERCFEFLVNVLCAADETHARHAEAVRVERFFGRGDERGMIGQAEIIVRAHVEHAFAAGDRDVGILRTGDDPLGFEEALRFNFFERLRKLFCEFSNHMRSKLQIFSRKVHDGHNEHFRMIGRLVSVVPVASFVRDRVHKKFLPDCE